MFTRSCVLPFESELTAAAASEFPYGAEHDSVAWYADADAVEVVVVGRRERCGCAADECGREEERGKRGH